MSQGISRQASGIALVLLASVAFAIGPTAARLALDNGSNTLTVVALRSLVSAVLMAGLLLAAGGGLWPPRRAWPWCLACGAMQAVGVYGFIGSVALIPVGAAVLVFFTHPMLIAFVAHLRGRERLTPRKLALAVLSFAGLAAVLAPEATALDPLGLGLAAVAAVAIGAMILCTGRAQAHASSTQVNLVASAIGALAFSSLATALGGWSLPVNTTGWLGILGAGIGVAVALLAFFAALRRLSMVRATMLTSIEPLLSILFAAAILGEGLAAWQWACVVLTVGALALFEAEGARQRQEA